MTEEQDKAAIVAETIGQRARNLSAFIRENVPSNTERENALSHLEQARQWGEHAAQQDPANSIGAIPIHERHNLSPEEVDLRTPTSTE